MSYLEIFLIIIVTIWTLVFISFGIALVFVLLQLKKALDKINHMVETAEEVTQDVGNTIKRSASGVAGVFAGSALGGIIKKIAGGEKKKNGR